MLFPKSRMKFTTSYSGKTNKEGWIVLDLTGAELDGVGKVYLPMEDISALRAKGDVTTDRLNAARSLLGGLGSEDEE